MLRKRSRASTTRRAPMSSCNSLPSPTEKYRKPTSSFLKSPRLFTKFSSCGFSDTEAVMSPTSTLDSKPFSAFKNSFWSDTSSPRTPEPEAKHHWDRLDSKGIGLAIIDALVEEQPGPEPSITERRMVLFGSQLKIKIPELTTSMSCLCLSEFPKSPTEFGINTRNSQLSSFSSCLSSSPVLKSTPGSVNSGLELPNSPGVFKECLSVVEMENSEEYTRVICHGTNPRTTHIFDNCVIESCCFGIGDSPSTKDSGFPADQSSYHSASFLSFCYNCKKTLGHGKDIYMYRGEKAFCSNECRYQEMLLEDDMNKLEAVGNVWETCS